MSKEWILNSAMNRYQLNFKRNVGPVSEHIRKCAPKTVEEWQRYYFANVYPQSHLDELGKKLYTKITEVLTSEIAEVTLDDCVAYMQEVVINRTFDGYMTEITTIYGQLEQCLNVKIEPAPDEWDRLFNVDFFIRVGDKFIGLQIKPVSGEYQIPEIFKERGIQEKTHLRFTEKYGGKVLYVFSIKKDNKKVIHNPQVIQEIKDEIERLS